MAELESQISNIQLGNSKNSNSFVYVFAENAPDSEQELYVVAEMPLLNPAAEDSCRKICLAISSTLKRSYRKTPSSFENSISQINEELGKLASLGQTHWIDHLNCIIGLKDGTDFTIATCGKVAAFLFRDNEFTDISCSSTQSHPLKTFENYATGKIRLDDLLILANTQLFNYLSMDRFQDIFSSSTFLAATQMLIGILKDNAGPEISFGILLNLQIPPGQLPEEEADLADYMANEPEEQPKSTAKIGQFFTALFSGDKIKALRGISMPNFGSLKSNTQKFIGKSKNLADQARERAAVGKKTLALDNFSSFSRQKKIFFFSALLLLIAFIIDITATAHYSKLTNQQKKISAQLTSAENLVSQAEAAMLYNNTAQAQTYLQNAQQQLPNNSGLSTANQQLYKKVYTELEQTEQKMDKITTAMVANLGSLGAADRLISLPDFLAVSVNNDIISYHKNTGLIQDGVLKSPNAIVAAAYTIKNSAVTYDGNNLYVWNFDSGADGAAFSQSVPTKSNLAGLAYYPVNSRIYVGDSSAGTIISFLIANNTLSKPVLAVKDPTLTGMQSFTIDGDIYALKNSAIYKYLGGKQQTFQMPTLVTPISSNAKIYTEKAFANIYILDAGNNRIVVMDKKGTLLSVLISPQFTKLKDFSVDETNKTIYVLNDATLLKVTY